MSNSHIFEGRIAGFFAQIASNLEAFFTSSHGPRKDMMATPSERIVRVTIDPGTLHTLRWYVWQSGMRHRKQWNRLFRSLRRSCPWCPLVTLYSSQVSRDMMATPSERIVRVTMLRRVSWAEGAKAIVCAGKGSPFLLSASFCVASFCVLSVHRSLRKRRRQAPISLLGV